MGEWERVPGIDSKVEKIKIPRIFIVLCPMGLRRGADH